MFILTRDESVLQGREQIKVHCSQKYSLNSGFISSKGILILLFCRTALEAFYDPKTRRLRLQQFIPQRTNNLIKIAREVHD
jgi:hypothetical protein